MRRNVAPSSRGLPTLHGKSVGATNGFKSPYLKSNNSISNVTTSQGLSTTMKKGPHLPTVTTSRLEAPKKSFQHPTQKNEIRSSSGQLDDGGGRFFLPS